MRNLKRVLTVCFAAVMLAMALTCGAFAAESKFTDVNANDETLTKAVSLLEGLGITKGTSATTFGTNENVTREQMAAFIYRLMHAGKSLEGGDNMTTFEDIYDDTYFGMISWANSTGIIKGESSTKFNPDGGIILQDAYTMLVRALGYEDGEIFSYPHSYISIAEQKGVELGEGLPSRVAYDTKLTRGNVAVLLYNAFYAEMAKTEISQEEKLIGAGTANAKYVLETVEKHPTLCEEIYEVIEESFVVRETTHYAFNDSKTSTTYKPTQDTNGKGTVLLVGKSRTQKVQTFNTTISELGLPGKADDYIMSEITVYYTYDEKKSVIDEILFAESHLKTVSSNKMEITKYRVTADSSKPATLEDYYTTSSPTSTDRRLSGQADVNGTVLYFYDAPYSFVSPQYVSGDTEADRYNKRNSDNTKLIDLVCLDVSKGLYSYYLTNDVFDSRDGYDTTAGTTTANNLNFATKFQLVLDSGSGSQYKVEIYDPDGDGRYEYLWYKPASYAKIVMTEKKLTSTTGVVNEPSTSASAYDYTTVPTLYAKEAKLYGAKFNDEDYVVAYVNADANMIDIFGVAEGKKGTITKKENNSGNIYLGNLRLNYIAGGKQFHNYFAGRGGSAWKSDWTWGFRSHFFGSTAALNTEIIAYVYNNYLCSYEVVNVKGEYSGENLLIPLETYTKTSRNEKFELEHYLKVLIDGEEKYILVDVENCYPQPRKASGSDSYIFDNTKTEENYKTYDVYYNKLCTYTVNKNGEYTIKSLLHGSSENKTHDHIDLVYDKNVFRSETKVNQAGIDLFEAPGTTSINGGAGIGPVSLKKVSSTAYEVVDNGGNSVVGTHGDDPNDPDSQDWFDFVNIENATFLFRVKDTALTNKKPDQLITYVGKELPGTVSSPLYNTQMIFQNRPGASTNTADLVVLYAEVDDELKFASAIDDASFVIVKNSEILRLAEEEYCYTYEVFNPASGELVSGVLGTGVEESVSTLTSRVTPYAPGSILSLTKAGKIDDDLAVGSRTNDVLFDNNPVDEKLAYIYEASDADRTLELVPVRSVADDTYFKWGASVANPFDIYDIAEDAKISVLKFKERENLETAEMYTITLAELEEADDSLKCYTSTYREDPTDPEEEYSTVYCKYVKAYVTATYKAKYDQPIIDTIVVVVHPGMSNSDTNLDKD